MANYEDDLFVIGASSLAGSVHASWADRADFERGVDHRPRITLESGASSFVDLHLEYYGAQT